MTYWTKGNNGSPLMHPGVACVSCHDAQRDAPKFTLAGTVYPTEHEPDDCDGVDPSYSAQVVITDANGKTLTLSPNDAGNFSYEGTDVALPYTAKVVYSGSERAMASAQMSGDCNSCHSQNGASGAPGRLFLP